MPWFIINTNVARSAVPPALLTVITEQLAKAMGKPASLMCVHVNADQMMTFGGTGEPVALCTLGSIGKLSAAENKTYSKLLCGLLNKHLGVSPERMYINFNDVGAANVGWNNKTFDGEF